MKQDEIIRMATEVWGYSDWKGAPLERLERFAALVAAHERERLCAPLRQLHDSILLASEPSGFKRIGEK